MTRYNKDYQDVLNALDNVDTLDVAEFIARLCATEAQRGEASCGMHALGILLKKSWMGVEKYRPTVSQCMHYPEAWFSREPNKTIVIGELRNEGGTDGAA